MKIIAAAFFLIFPRLAAAQVSFTLQPSTSAPMLGEPFSIEGAASLPAGQSLELDVSASSTDSYKVLGATVSQAGAGALHASVTVMPLSTGRLPIELVWKLSGSDQPLKSPPVVVAVQEPPLEAQPQLFDIKEPRRARPALWPWLLAAALLAAAYYLYKRYRGRAHEAILAAAPRDDRPPHVRAEAELAELEASGLWGESRYKEFYIRLTDIARRYLDGRFGIPADRLTTYELARQMREAEIDRKAASIVKDIFDRADLVKFAKTRPDADWGGRDVELAREMVRETAPRDLAESPAAGAGASGGGA